MRNCCKLGENLIFLISQPRAGSTLLQRILGSHPDIHTVSEPWLMLHPLYALRSNGHEAEYNARLARNALQDLLKTLPNGEEEYFEGVRRMYTYLYERALSSSGKRYFLDKTPRYYLIMPELYHTFPKARYIILLRNPLAVLCSIIKTWIKGDWLSLYNFKHDLIQAPKLLLAGIELLENQGMAVHYEQLVKDPASEVQRICDWLGIAFSPEMIEYGRHTLPRWHFGDQGEVYRQTRPTSENAERWVRALDEPQVWRLANDYLRLLGKEIVEQMGYPYEELQQILEAQRPHRVRLWFTFSMPWLLKKPVRERKWWWRTHHAVAHGIARVRKSLRHKGIRKTAAAIVRRVSNRE